MNPAYLAGVLDSDGSLTITIRHKARKNPNYCAFFQLTWTLTPESEKFLKEVQKIYGGSVYKPKTTGTFKNSRPTIKYFLAYRKLHKFVSDILPHVQLKKQQCLNILELLNSTKYGKNKPEELKVKHHNLYLFNKKLNTKNTGDRRLYANS